MAGNNIEPQVERWAVRVFIPMEEQGKLPAEGTDIYEAKEHFARLRDSCNSYECKVELDRARALLAYASCCGAALEEMNNANNMLYVTLSFETHDRVTRFAKNMNTAVERDTMR